MKELQQVTTKNLEKVEAGKRLSVQNRKKTASGVNHYYGIGAVIALGVIGGLGYCILLEQERRSTK